MTTASDCRPVRYTLIAAVALTVLVYSGPMPTTAQEETPTDIPTELPTPTETATALPTDTPTEISSLTPTETLIETPSETATLEPSTTPTTESTAESATATSSSEPTTEPSTPTVLPTASTEPLPPEPALVQYANEAFDNQDLSRWSLSQGWSLTPSEGGFALQTVNNSLQGIFNQPDLFEVAVQARFLVSSGSAYLTVRQSAAGSYMVALNANGQVSLYRGTNLFQAAQVSASAPGQRRTVRLSAIGSVLRVAVDGAEVIAALDTTSLPPGSVAIGGDADNIVIVDDFQLWLPIDEMPPAPSLQAEPQAFTMDVGLLSVFTVTNTEVDFDGECNADCSLLDAITLANNTAGADTINFAILGAGPHTIMTTDGFAITESVIIDATTQPGYVDEPLVEIIAASNASYAISIESGFTYDPALSVTIKGLSIGGATSGPGIRIDNGQNHLIEANFIGTDSTGTLVRSNQYGIRMRSPNNTIRDNLIVYNDNAGIYMFSNADRVSENNVVTGNAILVNQRGVWILDGASNNTIGGTAFVDGNVISGNDLQGIYIDSMDSSGNTILGNYIGTDGTGTDAFPNGSGGIVIERSSNNIIGGTTGTTPGGDCTGACNLISANTGGGIIISNSGGVASGNIVQGNYIGTDVSGTLDLGNTVNGIEITASSNTVGGLTPEARNIISGNNQAGILIYGELMTSNDVLGNFIGTDTTGNAPLGNGTYGVYIHSRAYGNFIGDGSPEGANIIAYNGLLGPSAGVAIQDNTTTPYTDRNKIRGNSIHSNNGLGIDLLPLPGVTANDANDADPGANALQNFPVITSIVPGTLASIFGTLNSTPNTTFDIDLYASSQCDPSGYGEGEVFLGFVTATTDDSGDASFEAQVNLPVPFSSYFTATAIDTSNGNTSEFSQCKRALANLSVTKTDSPDPVVVGNNLTYTVTVTNSGPDTATSVTLTDTLPANVPFISATPTTGSCNEASGVVTCNLGSIVNGGSVTTTIVVTINVGAASNITNTANVTADQADVAPSNNTVSASTRVNPPATPVAPPLLLPATNAQTNDTTPTFSWNNVANGFTYEIQLATNNMFTVGLQNGGTSAPTTSFTFGSALAEGVYYWRVRAVNIVGAAGPYSAVRSFTVDITPLAVAATVNTPANLAIVTTARPMFSWMALAGASRYRVQADDDPAFGTPDVNVVVTTTSYTIPAASPALRQGIYNWRVLAIDPAGNEGTNWSVAPQFTINLQTSPVNNAFSVDTTPTFMWTAVAGATGYQLQIATDTAFTAPAPGYPVPLGAVTTYTPTTVLGNGTYFWRILRNDETPVDIVHRTLTITPPLPLAPTLVSPVANVQMNDQPPVFSWSAVAGAANYEFQVDNTSNFSTTLEFSMTTPLTAQAPTSLAAGVYYWRVRAINSFNAPSPFSAVRSFTVDLTDPAAFNLNLPTDVGTVSTARPMFSWSASSGANRYNLKVDDDTDFSTDLVLDVTVMTTSFTIPTTNPALAQGLYHWQVIALDAASNDRISATRAFTVFIGTVPANGIFTTDTTPTFNWMAVSGATSYTLEVDDDTAFTTPVFTQSVGVVTTLTPTTPLPADDTYYWRVLRNGESPVSTAYRTLFIAPAPPAPTLTLPANAALLNDATPDLQWSGVTPPAGVTLVDYEIQVATNAAFTTGFQTFISVTNSFTPAADLSQGIHYWRVRARFDVASPGAFSALRSFTVDSVDPLTFNLNLPANVGIISTVRPTFTWMGSAGATSYRLQVATDPGFVFMDTETVVTGLTHTIPNIVLGLGQGIHYWRVTAIDAAGNETVSATRSFTVFSGIVPANGIFTTDTTPAFTWMAVSGATGYTLEVDDDLDFSADLVVDEPLGVVTTFTPTTTLPANDTYYWRVIPNGAVLPTLVSNTVHRTLFIAAAPAAPILTAPINAAFLNNSMPTFQWNAVTPPAGVSLSDYEIQIATNTTFTAGLQTFTSLTTSFTPVIPQLGLHYWRVRARFDVASPGAFSASRSFTVDVTDPGAFNLSLPADTGMVSTVRPMFSWSASSGANRYNLKLDDDADFSADLLLDITVTTTSYTIPAASPALAQGLYYWQVTSLDAAGNDTLSATRTFTVFIGTAPANNSFTTDTTPTFTWMAVSEATGYTLQIDDNTDFSGDLVFTQSVGAVTTLTPPTPLPVNDTYYWRVLRNGETPVSNMYRTLFIAPAPSAPTLTAPANAAFMNSFPLTFQWGAVTPPAGVTLNGYEIQIATNTAFTVGLQTFTNPTNSFMLMTPPTEGLHYWRVRARFDVASPGVFSAYRSFTFDSVAPTAMPTLTAPVHTSVITNTRTPKLTWTAVPTASRYVVEIALDAGFSTIILSQVVTTTSYTIPNSIALANSTYYWRISGRDAAGNTGPPSGVRSFTIAVP